MKHSPPLQETLRLRNTDEERTLLGREDRTLRLLRSYLGVQAYARKGLVTVKGEREKVEEAMHVLATIVERIRTGAETTDLEVEGMLRRRRDIREATADGDGDGFDPSGRLLRARDDAEIRAKSPNQASYVESIRDCDIVFAIGPAGTGKTYLATAMAIRMMRAGRFRKLCLVRPAVEAGEHLGFLPGDMTAKVSPYLRPLYDALSDFLEFPEVRRYQENDVIEVVPLAYMRGRTLDNAFIILDEGQNTTPAQMKMFLTRMGRRSKIVVTGDVTQTDLPRGKMSGLVDVERRLAGVDGIAFCHFGRRDIVRHRLVQKIVDAYEGSGVAFESEGSPAGDDDSAAGNSGESPADARGDVSE